MIKMNLKDGRATFEAKWTWKELDKKLRVIRSKPALEMLKFMARLAVGAGFMGEVVLIVLTSKMMQKKMLDDWNKGLIGWWLLSRKERKDIREQAKSLTKRFLDAWMKQRYGDDEKMFKELEKRLCWN